MRARILTLLLLLASSAAALLLAEGLLRALGVPASPLDVSHVRDPVLVYRMPSGFPGIDPEGFRNAVLREHADLVALGDSHTYGFNVEARDAWPEQLARITGLTTHNLGMGGYGPLQYLHLTGRALRLKPRVMVVALFPANDLEDVCIAVRRSPALEDLALREGLDVGHCRRGRARRKRAEPEDTEPRTGAPEGQWQLLRALRLLFPRPNPPEWSDPGRTFAVQDPRNPTLFGRAGLGRHVAALDLDDAEVAKNLDITVQVLLRIAERAGASRARLLVLLVPSKQLAYSDYLERRRTPRPEEFRDAVQGERRVKASLLASLAGRDLDVVDAEGAVARALETEAGVYPADPDRHPLAPGYRAYAEAVAEALLTSLDGP